MASGAAEQARPPAPDVAVAAVGHGVADLVAEDGLRRRPSAIGETAPGRRRSAPPARRSGPKAQLMASVPKGLSRYFQRQWSSPRLGAERLGEEAHDRGLVALAVRSHQVLVGPRLEHERAGRRRSTLDRDRVFVNEAEAGLEQRADGGAGSGLAIGVAASAPSLAASSTKRRPSASSARRNASSEAGTCQRRRQLGGVEDDRAPAAGFECGREIDARSSSARRSTPGRREVAGDAGSPSARIGPSAGSRFARRSASDDTAPGTTWSGCAVTRECYRPRRRGSRSFAAAASPNEDIE